MDFRLPSSSANGILVYKRIVAPCWYGIHMLGSPKKITKHSLVNIFLQASWFVGDLAALSPFAYNPAYMY